MLMKRPGAGTCWVTVIGGAAAIKIILLMTTNSMRPGGAVRGARGRATRKENKTHILIPLKQISRPKLDVTRKRQ